MLLRGFSVLSGLFPDDAIRPPRIVEKAGFLLNGEKREPPLKPVHLNGAGDPESSVHVREGNPDGAAAGPFRSGRRRLASFRGRVAEQNAY